METEPKTASPDSAKSDVSLAKVLHRNEQIKDQVEEVAGDLASVNTDLKQELGEHVQPPAVEVAIEKSEATEEKVMDAVDKLAAVNVELEEEVKELHSLHEKLATTSALAETARTAAMHDVLTGLPNRTLFNDRLEHSLQQAKRHGWALAVMFVDLDGFKAINDSHGHAAGDSVLKTIAVRLKMNARSDDTVCRHGGDEFLLLIMGGGDRIEISQIAKSVIQTIQAPCEVVTNNSLLSVCIDASIGIAVFPRDGTTGDALVKCADAAMYAAKRNRSKYLFAGDPDSGPDAQPRSDV